MSSAERSSVEMRQSPADGVLVDVLAQLRPWHDDVAVAVKLRGWVEARGWAVEDVQGVADELVKLGRHEEQLDAEAVAGITAFMLVNVSHGRTPRDYGMDPILGISNNSRDGYKRRHGNGALFAWLDASQYGQKLHQLTLHGRTEPAARRWIQRHPGVWPACQPTRATFARKLIRGGCRTREEFLQRHFSGDWPEP